MKIILSVWWLVFNALRCLLTRNMLGLFKRLQRLLQTTINVEQLWDCIVCDPCVDHIVSPYDILLINLFFSSLSTWIFKLTNVYLRETKKRQLKQSLHIYDFDFNQRESIIKMGSLASIVSIREIYWLGMLWNRKSSLFSASVICFNISLTSNWTLGRC